MEPQLPEPMNIKSKGYLPNFTGKCPINISVNKAHINATKKGVPGLRCNKVKKVSEA